MATAKRQRSKSDSRRKTKHKNRKKSRVDDEGIKYLGHAGKDVSIVVGILPNPTEHCPLYHADHVFLWGGGWVVTDQFLHAWYPTYHDSFTQILIHSFIHSFFGMYR